MPTAEREQYYSQLGFHSIRIPSEWGYFVPIVSVEHTDIKFPFN